MNKSNKAEASTHLPVAENGTVVSFQACLRHGLANLVPASSTEAEGWRRASFELPPEETEARLCMEPFGHRTPIAVTRYCPYVTIRSDESISARLETARHTAVRWRSRLTSREEMPTHRLGIMIDTPKISLHAGFAAAHAGFVGSCATALYDGMTQRSMFNQNTARIWVRRVFGTGGPEVSTAVLLYCTRFYYRNATP